MHAKVDIVHVPNVVATTTRIGEAVCSRSFQATGRGAVLPLIALEGNGSMGDLRGVSSVPRVSFTMSQVVAFLDAQGGCVIKPRLCPLIFSNQEGGMIEPGLKVRVAKLIVPNVGT